MNEGYASSVLPVFEPTTLEGIASDTDTDMPQIFDKPKPKIIGKPQTAIEPHSLGKLWFSELFIVEVGAGTAGLCSEARARGFDAIPIDNKFNRHVQKVKCILIDVGSDEGLELLLQLLDSQFLLAVHIAPPCGTASRARERPLSAELQKRGFRGPPPLRSAAFPGGMPGLSPQNQLKVDAANRFYDNSILIYKACALRDIFCSVENPRGSWMWAYSEWPQILANSLIAFVADFQACMHGSNRDKWTRFVATRRQVLPLRRECDKSHTHKPWGATKGFSDNSLHYATSEEAAYPALL